MFSTGCPLVESSFVAEVKSKNIKLRGKYIVQLRERHCLNDEVVTGMEGLLKKGNLKFRKAKLGDGAGKDAGIH